ncbi:[protein-PII] uridylyltransferase [Hoyosella sp. YIM 151337]|uniref:[protein-PII] uridylyltransferase n=1 Tax=Hoyosella sp. YIM 151337 TaxID=2992742 RepID=UPI002235CF90|nr:[protein-PII] uridylyltransferase [Hoyosella sp. YIM 151337]MCW4353954.1 [protein-PII] uridylyltransferase [Hoyosella sp. YIM 151337]
MPSDPARSKFRGGPVPAAPAAGAGPRPSAGPSGVSTGAADLARARQQLLAAGTRLDAPALRDVLVDLFEVWLHTKGAELGIKPDSGFAIVAVGGLGRREMLPYSDLDLILLHDDANPKMLSHIADSLWYPLWDAHIKLDHSVRTVRQALDVAAGDMTAALGMLEARHIVGDSELSAQLLSGVRQGWRDSIRDRFTELVQQAEQRWERNGEIAHRSEPDLKNGRGGLRDIQLLNALAVAQLTDPAPGFRSDGNSGRLQAAHRRLLDIRTQQHRVAGRARDQLRAQDADEVAAALHIGDRFDLARTLSDCARTISFSVEVGVRTARNALPRGILGSLRKLPARRPLDEGVVEQGGEVVLARDARPQRDPALVVRAAAAAAVSGLPMSAGTLGKLADTAPELKAPWPREAVHDLLVLLGSGRQLIPVVEALDRTGLWGRILPEWGAVRDLPPRDAIHTWTVDRHLVETVAYAVALSTRVSRPDLLLLGALLHDIGKGRGGDHSVVGAELAVQIGRRMGLSAEDTETLSDVVRHHLLLPHTATRRDIENPDVVHDVVARLGGSRVLLELLHALAEADSHATGPGVWGEWKATLIAELVSRCELVMAGEDLPQQDPVPAELLPHLKPGAGGEIPVRVRLVPADGHHMYELTISGPDKPGLLAKAAGLLSLHSLRVHAASVSGVEGAVLNVFMVSPRFGSPPDPGFLRQELVRAISGSIDVIRMLDERQDLAVRVLADELAADPAASGVTVPGSTVLGTLPAAVPIQYPDAPPIVRWLPGSREDEGILEVRSADRLGLLCRVALALEGAGADITWAKVATMGAYVDDVFCVRFARGAGNEGRARADAAVRMVLPKPAPPKPPTPGVGEN